MTFLTVPITMHICDHHGPIWERYMRDYEPHLADKMIEGVFTGKCDQEDFCYYVVGSKGERIKLPIDASAAASGALP